MTRKTNVGESHQTIKLKRDEKMKQTMTVLLVVFGWEILFPKVSHAYLDLGTGSFVLQIVLASAISVLFLMKGWWRKLTLFFRELFSRNKNKRKSAEKGNLN